jgi:hypothetical protein
MGRDKRKYPSKENNHMEHNRKEKYKGIGHIEKERQGHRAWLRQEEASIGEKEKV